MSDREDAARAKEAAAGPGQATQVLQPPSVTPSETTAAPKAGEGTPATGEREKRPPEFSRPEDRGEDLSALPVPDLVKRLAESRDTAELRKAAKALGDKGLAGELALSDTEKAAVHDVVVRYLSQSGSKDSNERTEARQQVERLWHTSAPALLEKVDSSEPGVAELAIKSLILMRNEAIVNALIEKAQKAQNPRSKGMALFALSMMTEQRESLIPGRTCMGEAQSKALFGRLIKPVLEANPRPAE